MIGARPPKVTPAAVERILEDPPAWLAGSYLPTYRGGRYGLEVLAYAVTAAFKLSPYDEAAVDEVARILRRRGYPESCAPPPFADYLTNLTQDDGRDATWT